MSALEKFDQPEIALREIERRLTIFDQVRTFVASEMTKAKKEIGEAQEAKNDTKANWHGGYWNALCKVQEHMESKQCLSD